MSSGMYELKPANLVSGLNIVLPKENVRDFLIANKKIVKISEPSEFRKGIVLDIKVTKEGLLLLLSTNEAFESLRKIFKTESIDWYVLKGILKNEHCSFFYFSQNYKKSLLFWIML